MNLEPIPDDIKELIAYFGKKGDFDLLLAKKVVKIFAKISLEDRARAIDYLTENREKRFGLDVPAVRQALRETGTKSSEYVPAEPWTCDACGMEFQYYQMPTDEDRHDKGLHDSCPRCGFQVCWTLEVQAMVRTKGLPRLWEPEWYAERKKLFKSDHEPGKAPHYNRREDDAFIDSEKKRKARSLIDSLTDKTDGYVDPKKLQEDQRKESDRQQQFVLGQSREKTA